MKADCYGLTDPGLKRNKNDDYYLIDEQLGLFMVCDGVGGNLAGNVASETCARTVREFVARNRAVIDAYARERTAPARMKVAEMLQAAFQEANARIFAESEKDPTRRGMSTTAEALLLTPDYALLAHVGDSRIYLLRAGTLHQLTEDHKVSVEMQKQGLWTEEDAKNSPYARAITRAVGIQDFVKPDLLQVELMDGDLFLLCSDGLADYFAGQEFKDLSGQTDLPRLPEHLIKFAKSKGGHDNITAVVARIEPDQQGSSEAMIVLKKEEALGKVPLFRYLDYAELTKVLSIARVKTYQPGSELIRENTPSDEMYILVTGKVTVKKGGQPLATKERGATFGEMGLFDNAPRSATVAALESTTVMILSRKDLLALLRREAQIAVKFLWALNQDLNQRLRSTSQDLAEARAKSAGKEAPFAIPPRPQASPK